MGRMEKSYAIREKQNLAANVRQLCDEHAVSFLRLAQELKISRQWITEITQARANVTLDLLGKIAKRFQTSIVELISKAPAENGVGLQKRRKGRKGRQGDIIPRQRLDFFPSWTIPALKVPVFCERG